MLTSIMVIYEGGTFEMCQSNAYIIKKDGREEMILSDIISIKPKGNCLSLTNLFGEEEVVDASIEEVDLINHKIKLKPR